ncbi:MAG: hybrid sensor histidine kinase/response regulator transcription factor [Candidatus Zhuqueibacterota bacterium]
MPIINLHKKLLLFILSQVMLIISPCYSTSEFQFERLTTEHGLSNNTVFCIVQDAKGFLWIGTENGLNRYDGKHFKIFRNDPQDSTSISDNDIRCLFEDSQQRLWICTHAGGLNRFDREQEKFIRYQNKPREKHSLIHNKLAAICEDPQGGLWIATRSAGLDYFRPESGKFVHFKENLKRSHGPESQHLWDLHIDQENVLWIATENTGLLGIDLNQINWLKPFDPDTVQIQNYPPQSNHPFGINHYDVRQILAAPDGLLWFGTAGRGVNYWDQHTQKYSVFQNNPSEPNSLCSNFVNRILIDRSGRLWAGTWGEGLCLASDRKNFLAHFKNDPEKNASLSQNAITAIYEDRSGNIWVGTWGGGLNKINPFHTQFQTWRFRPYTVNGLGHKIVQAIYEDTARNLWVGTYHGLTRIQRDMNTFHQLKIDLNGKIDANTNYIVTIYEDRSGQLWVGTGYGLYQIDRNRLGYKKIPSLFQPLAENKITAIFEEPSGDLWIGTGGDGLYQFKRQSNRLLQHFPQEGDSTKISSHTINFIYSKHPAELWIGTDGGINRYDAARNQFEQFLNRNQPNYSFLQNSILAAYEDAAGRFWIGSQAGLFRLDIPTRTFYPTGIDAAIYGILEDHELNLWISTNQGLIHFDPEQGMIKKRYHCGNGLVFDKFHQNAFFKSPRTGELFFGGVDGMVSFFPKQIRINSFIPPIVFTDFQIFNQSVNIGSLFLQKSIAETEEITLTHSEKVISFEFAALDFVDPTANQYAYQMEGFEQDWVQAGNRSFVTYTNLSPGNYRFKVKGTNNDGRWNETGATVRLKIRPPYWRTTGAYLIYTILISLVIYGGWRFNQYRARLHFQLEMKQFEAEQLKEMDRLKSRFFANISHEFRTPITLIRGPLEKWIAKITDTEAHRDFSLMRRNVQRLHRLINQLLDLSRIEAGKMELHPTTEDLVRLVNHYVQSFESQAKLKEVQLLFESGESCLLAQVDREKMENIIYNLISNALKFTPKDGKVTVSVNSNTLPNSESRIEIKVSDTGIGIPADRLDNIFDRFYQVDDSYVHEHEGSGIGLALTKELVGLHSGEIFVNSEPGVGSIFTVLLPVGNVDATATVPAVISEIPIDSTEGAPATTPAAESSRVKDKPIVLIVEDNNDLRSYIGDILNPHYQLIEAGDGVGGLVQAKKHVPDLIISDVMMPKMDGFQLCAKLKTDEITSHIPVILLTARATKASKLEGLETGADDYLIKPFDADELQVRINNLINQRRQLRARFSQKLSVERNEIAVTSADERFMQRALNLIEENIADPEFGAEEFSRRIGLSRSQLHRKLHALTGQSTTEFIRSIRLRRAASLLKQGYGNISEIAFEVGFNHLSYFSQCFRKEFGVNPSEYI